MPAGGLERVAIMEVHVLRDVNRALVDRGEHERILFSFACPSTARRGRAALFDDDSA